MATYVVALYGMNLVSIVSGKKYCGEIMLGKQTC